MNPTIAEQHDVNPATLDAYRQDITARLDALEHAGKRVKYARALAAALAEYAQSNETVEHAFIVRIEARKGVEIDYNALGESIAEQIEEEQDGRPAENVTIEPMQRPALVEVGADESLNIESRDGGAKQSMIESPWSSGTAATRLR